MTHAKAKAALVAAGYQLAQTRYFGDASLDMYNNTAEGTNQIVYIFRGDKNVDSVKIFEELTLV